MQGEHFVRWYHTTHSQLFRGFLGSPGTVNSSLRPKPSASICSVYMLYGWHLFCSKMDAAKPVHIANWRLVSYPLTQTTNNCSEQNRRPKLQNSGAIPGNCVYPRRFRGTKPLKNYEGNSLRKNFVSEGIGLFPEVHKQARKQTDDHQIMQIHACKRRAGPKGVSTKRVSMKRSNFPILYGSFLEKFSEIALIMVTPFVETLLVLAEGSGSGCGAVPVSGSRRFGFWSFYFIPSYVCCLVLHS